MQREREFAFARFQADFPAPNAGHRCGNYPCRQHVMAGPASRVVEIWHIGIGFEFIKKLAIHAEEDCPYVEQLVSRPLAHAELMRHHARPRLQVADKLRAQIQVGAVAKIENEDTGLAEIICEQVALDKLNTISHPSLGGLFPAFLNQLWVDLDSHGSPRTEIEHGGHDHGPRARTPNTDHG